MAAPGGPMRPLASWKIVFRQCRIQKSQRRWESTILDIRAVSKPAPLPLELLGLAPTTGKKIHPPMKTYPPLPSTRKKCVDPLAFVTNSQITLLDPTGARKRLFARDNPEAAKVGDILLVRVKNGEPFAGVCLNIRRRGVDTGILLRNQLTRVGVEMWYKVFSPKVTGIEVVQRRQRRARRAKLYFMRQPKHDMGSVEGLVRNYNRQRAMLGTSRKGQDSYVHSQKSKGKKGKKGKK